MGRQQRVCDEPRAQQHLVRLPDLERQGGARAALCTGKPKLLKRSPLTVRFTYKEDAEWSDGKEVTAADFRATWQVFVDPANNVVSRTGWEDVASVGGGNGKTVTVVFKKLYAAWESLVSGGPIPLTSSPGRT